MPIIRYSNSRFFPHSNTFKYNFKYQKPVTESLKTTLRYYGVSPWEIEVLYGLLNSHFTIVQEEIEIDDERFVSSLDINIPLEFNEAFFQWFDFKRWERVKSVFKEMKRRRGSKNALKIRIGFSGKQNISFTIDSEDKHWFNNALEKIDAVLEILPYHRDSEKMPAYITGITYKFDSKVARWQLNTAVSSSQNKRYAFNNNSKRWDEVT